MRFAVLVCCGALLAGCARSKPAASSATPAPQATTNAVAGKIPAADSDGVKKQARLNKTKPEKPKPAPEKSRPVITPDESAFGKVLHVNRVGRFVVVNFPAGTLPQTGQRLYIYRDDLKVAEIRITGPQQDTSIVADVLNGEVRVNDEVREN